MNKPFANVLKKGVLLILLLSGSNLSADIVYPARLQLTETAPGIFDVYFVLPVIQGKIVKARAVFPEFCQSQSEPLLEIDAYQKKMRWQIGCGSNPLIGSEIGIEGLLGSQIDIILEIYTLDGRTYKSTLSPARPYYKVPEAPGIGDLLKTGSLASSRYILLSWATLLMILVYFLTWKPASLGPPTLAIGVGLSLGYLLNWNEWILVPSWAGRSLSLLVSAALAWSFSSGKKSAFRPYGRPTIGNWSCFLRNRF